MESFDEKKETDVLTEREIMFVNSCLNFFSINKIQVSFDLHAISYRPTHSRIYLQLHCQHVCTCFVAYDDTLDTLDGTKMCNR